MCHDTVKSGNSYMLQCVTDWFVRQKQIKIWYDDNDYCNDYENIKLSNCDKNARPKKTKIK